MKKLKITLIYLKYDQTWIETEGNACV